MAKKKQGAQEVAAMRRRIAARKRGKVKSPLLKSLERRQRNAVLEIQTAVSAGASLRIVKKKREIAAKLTKQMKEVRAAGRR